MEILLDLLRPQDADSSTEVVSAVSGMAGVGKTALALYVAHEVAARGWFSGGVLFISLQGHAQTGSGSDDQVHSALLRALGVRDEDLPPSPEEQAGLYQSELARLAEQDRPVLIVADDAAGAAQVRPLIPAQGMHRLLVTSRDTLASVPARLLELGELIAEPAAEMIARALERARPDESRPRAEPHALAQVAAQCGWLPLALRIAAALLIDDPGLPIAALAEDLAGARTRLAALHYNDGVGTSLAVEAAFALSYERLGPQQQRLFRLLPLNPGPDFSTDAAAALTGRHVHKTRQSLAALARMGLLAEQPVGSGRWRMHDLIRLYATNLAEREGGWPHHALDSLLNYYLSRTSPSSASAWLDSERLNLVSLVALAAATGHQSTAMRLAGLLNPFLLRRRYLIDALAVSEQALACAREQGDRIKEGDTLSSLGFAFEGLRRFDHALQAHRMCMAIFQDLGDRRREALTMVNIGAVLREMGRTDESIDVSTLALAKLEDLDEQKATSAALNNLGTAFRLKGRYEESIDFLNRSVAISQKINDRDGETRATGNLIMVLREVRGSQKYIDMHYRVVDSWRELDDRDAEGRALNNLGIALRELGRFKEAIDAYSKALTIHRELSDQYSQCLALNGLGIVLRDMRLYQDSFENLTEALNIARGLAEPKLESHVLNSLGLVLRCMKRSEEAIEAHTEDLHICRELNDRHGEGAAANNLGSAFREARRFSEAAECHEQAVAIHRELGDKASEFGALMNLGTVHGRMWHLGRMFRYRRRASAILINLAIHGSGSLRLRNLITLYRKLRDSRHPQRIWPNDSTAEE